MSFMNQISQFIDFILQYNPVSAGEIREHFIDEVLRHGTIGTAIKNNAVFSMRIHLDEGIAAGNIIQHADMVGIDVTGLKSVQKKGPVLFSDSAGMIDFGACFCDCDGLIQTFAAHIQGS